MSSLVTCPSCKTKLRLPDLPARSDSAAQPGARVARPCKCPSCGTTFSGVLQVTSSRATPSETRARPLETKAARPKPAAAKPKDTQPAEVLEPDEEPDPLQELLEPDEPEEAPKRKAKRRRKRQGEGILAWFGQTLLLVGPIHVSPAVLLGAGVLLIPLVWWLIALNPLARPKPTAQAVEMIRTPFHAPRLPGPGVPPGTVVFFELMRGSDVVVTRPNRQGDMMLVTLPIPSELLDKVYGSKSMIATIPKQDIKLLCDGQTIEPICMLDSALKKGGVSWYCPSRGGGFGGVILAPPEQLSANLKRVEHDTGWKIQSDGGMLVEFGLQAESDEARLAWDAKSIGWKGTSVANKTSSIGNSWEVKCLFPKPANVRNMQIQVWNEPPQPLPWSE